MRHVFLALTPLIVASGGNTAFAQYDCPGGQRPVPPCGCGTNGSPPMRLRRYQALGLEICASCATRGTCIRTHLFPTPCREAAITGFGDHPNASITRCIARAFGSSPRPNRVIDRRDMGDQHTAYAGSVHLSEGDLLASDGGHARLKRGKGGPAIAPRFSPSDA